VLRSPTMTDHAANLSLAFEARRNDDIRAVWAWFE
jgi:hypothetical protein